MEIPVLKEKLARGEVIVGPWVLSETPSFAEVPGLLGFDFVYFDREHTTTSWERLEVMILAARSTGTPVIVRVEDNDPVSIRRVIEIGAQGVLVPHVRDRAEAEALVKAAKFPPEGIRGLAGTVRSAKYNVEDWDKYIENSNREVLVCALIEDKSGIENIEEIVSVKGLDCVCFGYLDYSGSVGVPGQGFKAKEVSDAFDRLVEAAKKAGVYIWLSPAPSLEVAKRLIEKGVQILVLGTDLRIFYNGMKDIMENIVKKLK